MSAGFFSGTEWGALAGFLDRQRDALVRKVRGVSDADAPGTDGQLALGG